MANRPNAFGLTAEAQAKIMAKYDLEMAQQAVEWMQTVVGEELPGYTGNADPDSLHECLKDGQFLCKVVDKLNGPVKFNTSKMAFKQMENIGKFLDAAEKYGVARADMFQTVDLYEAQNMWQVVCAIHALGRKAQSRGQQGIGPKEAEQNKREFTEEQLKAGQNVIGLQMGSNKGASQAGMSFGKGRHIMDTMPDAQMSREGQQIVSGQYGYTGGANAAGQNFGKSRQIID